MWIGARRVSGPSARAQAAIEASRVNITGLPVEAGKGTGKGHGMFAGARRDLQRAALAGGMAQQDIEDRPHIARRCGRAQAAILLSIGSVGMNGRAGHAKRAGLRAATIPAGSSGLRSAIRSAINWLAAGAVWNP